MLPPNVPIWLAPYSFVSHSHDSGTVTCADSVAAYFGFPVRCKAPGCIRRNFSIRLSSAGHFLFRVSFRYLFSSLLFLIYKAHYMDICWFCQEQEKRFPRFYHCPTKISTISGNSHVPFSRFSSRYLLQSHQMQFIRYSLASSI